MATDIVGSLFGVNPQAYQQAQQNRAYNQDYQAVQLDPIQQANLALRQGGRGFGQLAGGLLGMEDPELAKASKIKQIAASADLTSPEGMVSFANQIQPFAPTEAAMAIKRAEEMTTSAATVTQKTRESVKQVGQTPDGRQVYQQGDTQYVLGGDGKRVPYYGGLASKTPSSTQTIKAFDLEGGIRKDFLGESKPFRDPFIAADKLENLLTSESSLADKISKKQWSKIAGDATISNKDTDALTNYGDLGTRLNGIITQFAEGKYSDAQRTEALNLVRMIKQQSESGYNEVRNQYKTRASSMGVNNEDQLNYLAPVLPKTSKAFVVGKSYKDKNGVTKVFKGYKPDGSPDFQ
jgi:hypothetical protein